MNLDAVEPRDRAAYMATRARLSATMQTSLECMSELRTSAACARLVAPTRSVVVPSGKRPIESCFLQRPLSTYRLCFSVCAETIRENVEMRDRMGIEEDPRVVQAIVQHRHAISEALAALEDIEVVDVYASTS